eukprot:scaffold1353_cov161-Amphora_coffeaeformis.AAC.3
MRAAATGVSPLWHGAWEEPRDVILPCEPQILQQQILEYAACFRFLISSPPSLVFWLGHSLCVATTTAESSSVIDSFTSMALMVINDNEQVGFSRVGKRENAVTRSSALFFGVFGCFGSLARSVCCSQWRPQKFHARDLRISRVKF